MIFHKFENQINAHTAKWAMVFETFNKGLIVPRKKLVDTDSTVTVTLHSLPCLIQNIATRKDFSRNGIKFRKISWPYSHAAVGWSLIRKYAEGLMSVKSMIRKLFCLRWFGFKQRQLRPRPRQRRRRRRAVRAAGGEWKGATNQVYFWRECWANNCQFDGKHCQTADTGMLRCGWGDLKM